MKIETYRVKQYNSTYKTVVMVDGIPVCIVRGQNTLSKIISFLSGYNVKINDGKIEKILKKTIERGKNNE